MRHSCSLLHFVSPCSLDKSSRFVARWFAVRTTFSEMPVHLLDAGMPAPSGTSNANPRIWGASIRLAMNLDLDDVARRSSKPRISFGDRDDIFMFVASPQAD